MRTRTAAWRVRHLAPLGLTGCFAALALATGPAIAQTLPLNYAGNVVIQGGGQDGVQSHYTGDFRIGPGSSSTLVLSLPVNSTLRISGPRVFGEPCGKGSDCLNTKICADGVCGWSGLDVSYPQCGSRPDLMVLDQRLDDCVRLWAVDNPANLPERANMCMQIGAKLYGSAAIVSGSCPQMQQYRAAFDLLFSDPGVSRNVLMKAIRQGISTTIASTKDNAANDAQRVDELRSVLRVIDTWFRGEVEHYGTANNALLLSKTKDVTDQFWRSAFVNELIRGAVVPVGADDAAKVLKDLDKNAFLADQQVLRAAFDGGGASDAPLQTAPLLPILTDAISGLAERIQSLVGLQDIVCSVRPCFPGHTSLGNYMKVIGTLAQDGTTLGNAITVASTTPTDGSPNTSISSNWKQVFELISKNHAVLENAVLSAADKSSEYTPSALEGGDLGAISKHALALAAIVSKARSESLAFEATGRFRPRPHEIRVGLDESRNTRILGMVDSYCNSNTGSIPSTVAKYRTSLNSHLANALSVATAEDNHEKAATQLRSLREQYDDLSKDLAGLRASHHGDGMKYGDFMLSFQNIAPAISTHGQSIPVTSGQKDIDVSALLSTRYDAAGGTPVDIRTIAAEYYDKATKSSMIWMLSREAGDLINFEVSGTWAPTCALRDVVDPSGKKVNFKDGSGNDFSTGPEGYRIERSASGSEASSVSSAVGRESYVSGRITAMACGGTMAYGSGAQVCGTLEVGQTASLNQTDSNATTNTSLTSFSWGEGIRSAETPFPDNPVGSLLLVELPRGETALTAVKSVQVVTYPHDSVLVKGASDFYLVVNDKKCDPVSDALLNVRVAEMEPPDGALVQTLLRAMVEAVKTLRETAPNYVSQGQLFPSDRANLYSETLKKIYENASVARLDIAPSLQTLLETYINAEIARIDREIQMVMIERQMKALFAQEEVLKLEMASAEASGRTASIMGGLAVRQLDLTQLEALTYRMSDLVNAWMVPVLNLRLVGDLSFTAGEKELLDAVVNLSPEGMYDNSVIDACKAVETLVTKIQDDKELNPVARVKTVIFGFPNVANKSYREPIKGIFREVDSATAKNSWEALSTGGDLEFTVTPEMFYEEKEPFSLNCNLTAPTVLSMAYYLVMSGSVSGPFDSELTTVFPDNMKYPRPDRLHSYSFTNGTYLFADVPIFTSIYGDRANVEKVIGNDGAYWSSQPAMTLPNKGTSPFARYHLNLEKLRKSYLSPDGVTLESTYPFKSELGIELLVAFRVEAILQDNTVLPGVVPCQ
jgi:hypothetical protein